MANATTALMTAEEFIRDYGDRTGYELDRGILVRTNMPGGHHGFVCGRAFRIIEEYVRIRGLGRVCCNDTYVRVHSNPASYRGADVLFVSFEKIPQDQQLPSGPLDEPPELVVEVRSPTDRLSMVLAKGQEYLDAGVKCVMIIDPETESVGVFREEELPIRYHNGDTVTLSGLFPDFAVPVKAFFK